METLSTCLDMLNACMGKASRYMHLQSACIEMVRSTIDVSQTVSPSMAAGAHCMHWTACHKARRNLWCVVMLSACMDKRFVLVPLQACLWM